MSDSQNQNSEPENLEGAGDDPSAIPTWYGGIVFTILFVVSAYLLAFLTAQMGRLGWGEVAPLLEAQP